MLIRALSIICLFCCSVCFSGQYPEKQDPLLTEIILNDCECIVNIVDDKAYVNPERIFATAQGLFLHVNADQFVAIPLLHSDSQGCYIRPVARIKVTSPCPHCGWERISGAWKCRNPDCPSNRPKE